VVPCGNCIKSRIECTLDHTADKRRRGALKRKIDQLEEKEDLLIRLVEVLRESGNSRTGPLINLIRSNASLAEIRYYLDHELPQSELAQTPALAEVFNEVERVQQSESRSIRRILDAKRLSDIPRFQVPARPWTTVVEDNDFVSHLVSLWFTWCHPFSNWIDRDRFVKDMQAGSLEARYCSPFLVNIILAEACVCIFLAISVCSRSNNHSRTRITPKHMLFPATSPRKEPTFITKQSVFSTRKKAASLCPRCKGWESYGPGKRFGLAVIPS
jgi:hypothetical protein